MSDFIDNINELNSKDDKVVISLLKKILKAKDSELSSLKKLTGEQRKLLETTEKLVYDTINQYVTLKLEMMRNNNHELLTRDLFNSLEAVRSDLVAKRISIYVYYSKIRKLMDDILIILT